MLLVKEFIYMQGNNERHGMKEAVTAPAINIKPKLSHGSTRSRGAIVCSQNEVSCNQRGGKHEIEQSKCMGIGLRQL